MTISTALDPHDRQPHRHRDRRQNAAGITLSAPVRDDASEFAIYVDMLRDHWRMAAGVFAMVFLVTALVAALLPPVFDTLCPVPIENCPPPRARLGRLWRFESCWTVRPVVMISSAAEESDAEDGPEPSSTQESASCQHGSSWHDRNIALQTSDKTRRRKE